MSRGQARAKLCAEEAAKLIQHLRRENAKAGGHPFVTDEEYRKAQLEVERSLRRRAV